MTCIIGIQHKGKVYMGGDSMAAAGWDSRKTKLRKVFINGNYLIGYSTSFRMGQLLQYATLPVLSPDIVSEDEVLAFMVKDFVSFIRELFKNNGYAKIDNNREEAGSFLVAIKGCLFSIQDDYQVNLYQDMTCTSIGCGANYALGALMALRFDNPHDYILSALNIAGSLSNGVCEPYYVLECLS